MHSILLKNMYFYKRNWKELLSFALRVYVALIPIYIFSLYITKSNVEIGFIISTTIIVGLFSNLIIAANYELDKEVKSGKIVNLSLANMKCLSYAIAQCIFYFIIYSFQYLVLIFIFTYLEVFKIELSYITIILIILLIIKIIVISALISTVFSLVTIKTRNFSYSSMMVGIVLLMSSVYTNIENTNNIIRITSYISPFTYIVNIYRHIFIGETLIFSYLNMILIIALQMTILIIFINKKVNKFIDRAISKGV